MTLTPRRAARCASVSPMRKLRSSDSTTHGPAMRNGAVPPPNRWAMSVGELRQLGGRGGLGGPGMAAPVVERRANEPPEQRMWAHRPRLELGVELAADEPWMVRQLDDLHQGTVGREARAAHPVLGELVAIGVGHFVAVAVPLAHFAGAIGLRRARAGPEAAGIGAQPHGPAHLLDALLGAHQRDHRVLALRLELTRVGIGDLADVAGELDDGRLEAETYAEERELVFTRPADRLE